MLQQVVLAALVRHHIIKHLTDDVQLVESREDDRFRNLLSRRSTFFYCSFFVFFFSFTSINMNLLMISSTESFWRMSSHM